MANQKASFVRVDTFSIPEGGFQELQSMIRVTLAALSSDAGFVSAEIFTQHGEKPGIATVVRWSDKSSAAGARETVFEAHARHQFDALSFYGRHGIQLDRRDYESIESYNPSLTDNSIPRATI